MSRIADIDRLRAIAVLGTIFCHIDLTYIHTPAFIQALPVKPDNIGVYGVLLFFVISGYVISSSLIPGTGKGKGNDGEAISSFFVKRIFRITPVCILWIAITLLASSYSGVDNSEGNYIAALYALINIYNVTQNIDPSAVNSFGSYWSLSLEEQFYLVFPFFVLIIKRNISRNIVIFSIIALTILMPNPYRAMFPFWAICCGIILYLNKSTLACYAEKSINLMSNPGFTLTLISCFLITIVMPAFSTHAPAFYASAQCIMLSVIVLYASVNKNVMFYSKVKFVDAAMAWVGTRSFSIYLAHVPVAFYVKTFVFKFMSGYGVNEANISWHSVALPFIIVMILSCELSYRFIEMPSVRLANGVLAKKTTLFSKNIKSRV